MLASFRILSRKNKLHRWTRLNAQPNHSLRTLCGRVVPAMCNKSVAIFELWGPYAGEPSALQELERQISLKFSRLTDSEGGWWHKLIVLADQFGSSCVHLALQRYHFPAQENLHITEQHSKSLICVTLEWGVTQ
eukprot:2720990-Pleurochrysis_carterae.AAC.6